MEISGEIIAENSAASLYPNKSELLNRISPSSSVVFEYFAENLGIVLRCDFLSPAADMVISQTKMVLEYLASILLDIYKNRNLSLSWVGVVFITEWD